MVFQIQTEYDIVRIAEKKFLIVAQTELVNVKPEIFDLELSKWRCKMNNEAIKKIAENNGFDEASRQLFEEVGELIVAVNKAYRLQKINICPFFDEVAMERKNAFNNVIEEIADVTIMLEQIKYLLSISDTDIDQIIEQKLNRQLERIEKNETNN